MTRIFTDGAEFGDVLFLDVPGAAVASAVQKRTGSYSYKLNSASVSKYVAAASEGYARVAVYSTFYGTSGVARNLAFRNGTTIHAQAYFNSGDNKIHLSAGGVADVAIGTNAYGLLEWHLIEMYLLIADNPNGRAIIKVNGITEIDFTGDTKNSTTTTYDNINYYNSSNDNTYIDDLAYNDTAGSAPDNTWCGDGRVILLTPNDNGDTNDWDGSDGDSVNNYLLVDDIPHDTDTTYVKTSVTEQDMYNVSDYDPAGGKIVRRIYAECRAKDNSSAGGTIKLGYKHGGTVYLCSSARALSGSYARVVGDEALSDPGDGTTWSEADLDAIQFVVECSSSSSSTSSSSSSSSTTSSSSSTNIP